MKEIRIFHISDLHIGMKFQNYPENLRKALVDARFQALSNAVKEADKFLCDILVIAGDLFESIKVSKKDMDHVNKILSDFSGEYILILPGNHDYYDETLTIWNDFSLSMSPKTIILKENKKYILQVQDTSIAIFAAPCGSKHSKENNLSWIKEEVIDENFLNILIAHGAIKEISPDLKDSYFPMTMKELEDLNLDICLLGHTHVPYPLKDMVHNSTIFNAGTPEPDGLNYQYEGTGWFIHTDSMGLVRATRKRLGTYKFFDTSLKVSDELREEDIMKLFSGEDLMYLIVRIKLQGYLENQNYENRYEILNSIGDKFAYIDFLEEELKAKFTTSIIDKTFSKNSLPYTLLSKLLKDTDDETAHYAYELMMEVRGNDK